MHKDIRSTIPEATRSGYIWLIDDVPHNYLRPADKHGRECGHVRLTGKERFAKYLAGTNYLVGVFLATADTRR